MSKLETPKRETEVSLRELTGAELDLLDELPPKFEVTAPHSSNLDASKLEELMAAYRNNDRLLNASIARENEANRRLRLAVNMIEVLMYDFDDDCSGGESGQIARDALALQK